MGCDGGTIPKRDELVKVKKKPEQKDKDAERSFRWRHCALSQQKLEPPIVACGLGRLYSKSAVLESLLDKINMPESIKHIRNMKDIKDLKLMENPIYDENAEKTEGAIDERGSPYICPVIGLEMSGSLRFVFFWSCGCVMSERAIKEIKMKICHVCQQPFTDNDIVVINGTDTDIEQLKIKLEARQAKLKSEKKGKSIKKDSAEVAPSTSSSEKEFQPSTGGNSSSNIEQIPLELPKSKKDTVTGSVAKPQKRQASETSMQDPLYKKTKDDYSVANDPKATAVYKSLFTSHHSDKDQKRAHWITYNPFYN